MVVDLIRSRIALEAEIWVLRQQINILRRTAPTKHAFSAIDRLIFVGLYRLFPKVRDALAIVQPDTIVRWHRAGFRSYWRWKSRPRGGRPTVPLEIRELIREMSIANPLWGAPRFMANCSSLASKSDRPAWRSIWPGVEARRRKVPPQSCRRHRGDGPFRRTDDLISLALWLVNHGAWSTTNSVARRHSTSDRGMDRKSTHGSLRLGASSPLCDP